MSANTSSASIAGTPGSQPGAASRRRRSEFLLPDGTKVLVAPPEEAEALRSKYAAPAVANPAEAESLQVSVVVHGSEEHQDALRKTQSHHVARRDALRNKFGAAFVDEWEAVSAELGHVTSQLERLTDHSRSLNANFSRFGFDARLRTYENEDENGTASSSSSIIDSGSSFDWNERRGGTTLKLFKKPVIKQYFHRGLLWRSSTSAEVMSFELFFDLLYVGIIAINGDHASESATGHELIRFVITFCMSWKIWSDVMQLISWFETDDFLQRVEILFLIACLLGLTTNMLQTFGEEHDTYVQLVGFYLTARFFMAAYCALTCYLLPLVRGMMLSMVINILFAGALWIGSTQVEAPATYGLAFAALAVDLFGHSAPIFLFRYSGSHDNEVSRRLGRIFEFYPAINIEHKVERTNAFVSLVIGYSVVGVMYSNAGYGLNAFLGKAVLGLVQAFVFNWLYFEIDGSNIHTHAIRRKVYTAMLWQWAHLIFIMSFILSSAALSRLVLAHDCSDTDIHTLAEVSVVKSEEEISLGLRFFYCSGLAIALFCMGLVSLSHEHKIPLATRLPKWVRLANRWAVCIVLLALPAAHELNSLHLVAITTSLSVWVLLLEIWGKSCRDDSFFMQDKDQCRYTARCTRRQLDAAMKSDGEINIIELAKGEKHVLPDTQ
ncbi:hypothetical protein GQ53DRAFT_654364 [Thozetella sp. PMI_491]|nr:hypothetical protein GQ53DRAFT_654364 [Thozetella sp. PMI_491]